MKRLDYKKRTMRPVDWQIFIGTLLGQAACGYALGISTPAFNQAQQVLHLSSFWLSLLNAGSLLGLFASLGVGYMIDRIGRRKVYLVDMWLLMAVSVIQALPLSISLVFMIRIIVGILIAVEYTVGITLMAEWLPDRDYGNLQSLLLVAWAVGYAGASLVNFSSWSWQIMLGTGAFSSLLSAGYRSLVRSPKSPSWLAEQGANAAAAQLIRYYIGSNYMVKVDSHREVANWGQLFDKQHWRQTAVSGIFYASQTFAFFGISFFLPQIFKALRIFNSRAVQLFYNGLLIIGLIIGSILINKLTRRTFLIVSFFITATLLGLVCPLQNKLAVMIVFCLFILILSSSLVLDYVYPAEIFSATLRGSGVGVSITISRIGAVTGTLLLPLFNTYWGIHASLLLCAGVLLLGGIICQLWAPETAFND